MRRAAAASVALALAGVILSGCGGSGSSSAKPSDQPGAPTIPVTLDDGGCTPTNFTVHAGDVVFAVTNPAGKKVTEMEVQDPNHHVRGDVEGVTAGHTRSFRVTLKAGVTYLVRCPESAPTGGTITVLGP